VKDGVITGEFYIGSNFNPLTLVFDTGSEYLATTSNYCYDTKIGKPQQKELADFFQLTYFKNHERCHSTGYDARASPGGKLMKLAQQELTYGTASFKGFLIQDQVCLSTHSTSNDS
jgi:hypothetical protein